MGEENNPTQEGEQPPQTETPEGTEAPQTHILGEIAGGICLASTMVAGLSLFAVAMSGIA